MQVFLPQRDKPNGGSVQLKIDFSFISPDFGSDRMGVLDTKMEKYLPWRNGTLNVCL
jgi:hypothetical protein